MHIRKHSLRNKTEWQTDTNELNWRYISQLSWYINISFFCTCFEWTSNKDSHAGGGRTKVSSTSATSTPLWMCALLVHWKSHRHYFISLPLYIMYGIQFSHNENKMVKVLLFRQPTTQRIYYYIRTKFLFLSWEMWRWKTKKIMLWFYNFLSFVRLLGLNESCQVIQHFFLPAPSLS